MRRQGARYTRACKLIIAGVLIGVCGLLSSCLRGKVYSHYADIPGEGWRQGDTLTFCTDTIRSDGNYLSMVGVRIKEDMPYRGISILVEQEIRNQGEVRDILSDTVDCEFVDDKGSRTGPGISRYQYTFPIRSQQLSHGDSLTVRLTHVMTTDTFPAITEVGYILTRE